MTNQIKDETFDKFKEFQKTCNHQGNFLPMDQKSFPANGRLMLLDTVICGNCGIQFVETIMTGINVGGVPDFNNLKK